MFQLYSTAGTKKQDKPTRRENSIPFSPGNKLHDWQVQEFSFSFGISQIPLSSEITLAPTTSLEAHINLECTGLQS